MADNKTSMILKVNYLLDGYFTVKYSGHSHDTIQDFGAMILSSPNDPALKEVNLFLRKLKIGNVKNEKFHQEKFKDELVYEAQVMKDTNTFIRKNSKLMF